MKNGPSTARVLLLHASVGMGHQRAAQALAQALVSAGADVAIADTLDYGRTAFRRVYRDLYLRVAERAPSLWSEFYTRTDRAPMLFSPTEAARRWGTALGVRELPQLIAQTQPDAVICTHFLPLEVLAPLRQWGGPPIYAAVTDYRAHHFWAIRDVDGYFVPTLATQQQLAVAGVPRARIHVTGIPIDPAINLPAAPGVRQTLGVSPQVPLVLINGSGIVAARVRAIVRQTLALRVPLVVLVAVGRNRALATALADLHSTDWATLHVLGPQPSLDPLIAASDIVVGKPGGLTVSEVLARGVPLLLVTPAPGQEHANARYVEQIGAGQCHTTAAGMAQAIAALVLDEPRRKAMAAAAKHAGRPAAAHTIAAHVLGTVERGHMFGWPHGEVAPLARAVQ